MAPRTAVTFVIMAGGRGERLWPLVRARQPKVCLAPDGTRTLLARTIERVRHVWPDPGWLIVTTHEQAAAVRAGLPAALRRAVLVEPAVKNTAACITLSAVALASRDPRRVMVVLPADHWIEPVEAFRATLRMAIRAAVSRDALVTIGIRPTHPHSGLGYLCAGSRLPGTRRPPVFRLARFIEKPSPALARRLVRRPRTYWNSGIFVGSADTFLEGVAEWLPEHARRLAPLAPAMRRLMRPAAAEGVNGPFARRAHLAYRALRPVSFDHGVMDHLRGGLVVEGRFRWADLGSWEVWARLGQPASLAPVTVGSERIMVVGQGRHLVAAVGVRDLLVVHTPSATLICHPEQTQAVRDVVRRIGADPRLAAYR